jgi:hypothetical protein
MQQIQEPTTDFDRAVQLIGDGLLINATDGLSKILHRERRERDRGRPGRPMTLKFRFGPDFEDGQPRSVEVLLSRPCGDSYLMQGVHVAAAADKNQQRQKQRQKQKQKEAAGAGVGAGAGIEASPGDGVSYVESWDETTNWFLVQLDEATSDLRMMPVVCG